jgi:hypothetical protein
MGSQWWKTGETGVQDTGVDVGALRQELSVHLPEIGQVSIAEGGLEYADAAPSAKPSGLCEPTGGTFIEEDQVSAEVLCKQNRCQFTAGERRSGLRSRQCGWIGELPNVEPIRLSNLVRARKSAAGCYHLGMDLAGYNDTSVQDI